MCMQVKRKNVADARGHPLRFYRTDQSRSREIGGTGLELAITRAIVEAYGGTIRVRNDGPGQGVTVTFRLPLNK